MLQPPMTGPPVELQTTLVSTREGPLHHWAGVGERLDSRHSCRCSYGNASPADRSHFRAVHRAVLEVALLATLPLVFSALGYSILYLLLGGGIGGAILIFVIAKMLRR